MLSQEKKKRRPHNRWKEEDVLKLIAGVEQLGVGHWRQMCVPCLKPWLTISKPQNCMTHSGTRALWASSLGLSQRGRQSKLSVRQTCMECAQHLNSSNSSKPQYPPHIPLLHAQSLISQPLYH